MNAVLRVYMRAVIAKEIERRGNRDWKGDLIRGGGGPIWAPYEDAAPVRGMRANVATGPLS